MMRRQLLISFLASTLLDGTVAALLAGAYLAFSAGAVGVAATVVLCVLAISVVRFVSVQVFSGFILQPHKSAATARRDSSQRNT